MIFLQELMAFGNELGNEAVQAGVAAGVAAGVTGGIIGLILAAMWLFVIIAIGLYIYTSFAFMAIAKKTKYPSPAMAWIPAIGPLIITWKASRMHWWPWLLLIGYFIPVLGLITGIIFLVYTIIWHWKMFELVGRPGWWAIAPVIPIIGGIAYLVFIGITAWSKE